jgi:uncharacterized protein (TIGR03435 family)
MLALACSALGQEFEVASVKPNKSISYNSSFRTDKGTLTATNVSLRQLIVNAYAIEDYQVEAADWIGSERFDVSATFPGAPLAAFPAMLQHMLADRFQLVVHREQKTRPVYALTAGKSGIKFKAAPDSDCGSHSRNATGTQFVGTCVSMDAFAQFLSKRRRDLPVDLPVLDLTGLKEFYNVKLDWVSGDNPSGTTLLVALEEQLGLRLETRKAPIDMLIVDHAEKVPSEN